MRSYEFPTLLVVAHDHTCSITARGRCNCDCTMEVLVGDLERPRGPALAPAHYGVRVAKLKQFFTKV